MPQRLAVEQIKTFAEGDTIDGVWEAGGYIWIQVDNGSVYDYWRYDPKTRKYDLVVDGYNFVGAASYFQIIIQYGANVYAFGESGAGEIFILRDGTWVEIDQYGDQISDAVVHEGRLFVCASNNTYYYDNEGDIDPGNYNTISHGTYSVNKIFSLNGLLWGLKTDISASYYPLVYEDSGLWVEATDYSVSGIVGPYNAISGASLSQTFKNGDFSSGSEGWSQRGSGNNWLFTSGYAQASGSGGWKTLYQPYKISSGESITIDFNYAVVGVDTDRVDLIVIDSLGNETILESYTSVATDAFVAGTHSFTATKDYIAIGFDAVENAANLIVRVDDVVITGGSPTTSFDTGYLHFTEGATHKIYKFDGLALTDVTGTPTPTTSSTLAYVNGGLFLGTEANLYKMNVYSDDWTATLQTSVDQRYLAAANNTLFIGDDDTLDFYAYYAPIDANIYISRAMPYGMNYFNSVQVYEDTEGVYGTCYEEVTQYGDQLRLQVLYQGSGTLSLQTVDSDGGLIGSSEMVLVGDNYYQGSLTVDSNYPTFYYIQVVEVDSSSPAVETIMLKSNVIKAAATVSNSKFIEYSNTTDHAGIKYTNIGAEFGTRIRLQDWKIQSPQEKSPFTLSDGTRIMLKQTVRKTRSMETDYMPLYMHEKMALILSHDQITIDGVDVVVEDSYGYEPVDKYGLTTGSATLTERSYEEENIY